MTRIRLNRIENPAYTGDLSVRVSDLNYGQHVGHDTLFAYLHEIRTQFLGQLGASEQNVGGCGLIMVNAEVDYKGQAFLGDRLQIAIKPLNCNRAGFDFVYQVNEGERLVLLARTGMACFDYEAQRPCRVPEAFLAQLLTLI